MKALLFLLLFCTTYSIAQTWTIGTSAGPGYYIPKVFFKSSEQKNAYFATNDLFPGWGFSAGAAVIRSLSDNYELETGLRFSHVAVRFRTKENSFPPATTHTDYHMKGHYLELPVKITFVRGEQFQLIGSFGIQIGFAIDRFSTTTVYSNEKPVSDGTSTYTKLAPATFTPGITLGGAWHFSDNWSIRALHSLQYSFPAGNPKSYQFYLWRVGLDVGVYYKLD